MTKIRKKMSKKKEEDVDKWVMGLEMHNIARRPHPEWNPPYPHSAYEEALLNKAYYDSCRQNVINGERAEHMRKSLFWLRMTAILLSITFCMCVIWSYLKLRDELIVPTLIMFGLALISTAGHEWHERKIKKLVNVK